MASTIKDTIVDNNNGYQLHYCQTDDGKTYIYNAPNNINSETKVVIYIPGTGGAYANSTDNHGSANDYIASMINNNENCILIVPKDAQGYANDYNSLGQLKGDVDAGAVEGMVSDVLSNYNLPASSLTTNISWSNGTTIGLKVGAHFLNLEGKNASPKTFMLINSAQYTPDVITDSELKTIADSNSNIIIMSEDAGAQARRKYQKWSDNYGITLYDINCNGYWGEATHSKGNTVFAANNGLSALLGTTTLALPTLFSFSKYNSKTQRWEDVDSAELDKLLTSMSSEQRSAIQTNYNDMLSNNYNALSNIDDLEASAEGKLSSNYDFVVTSMNGIRDMIRTQSQELANFKFPSILSSNSQLLSNVGIYVSNCSAVIGSILDSLALETESVVSYAEALVAMDNDINGSLSNITMLPLPENYSAIPNLQKTVQNTEEDEEDKDDGTKRYHYRDDDTDSKKQYKDKGIRKAYKCSDGSALYVTYDNDEIAAIEQKYFCLNKDELQSLYQKMQEAHNGDKYVAEIVLEEDGVSIVYNARLYENRDVDTLLKTYFNGGGISNEHN